MAQPIETSFKEFMIAASDLLSSKYILADGKISALLKSIAKSEDLKAVFEICLNGFDYSRAKKVCYVGRYYGDDTHKEVILPEKTNDLLAFVFMTLVQIDNNEIQLPEYLQTYFYEDGSFYESYNSFLANFISPFINALKGVVQDVVAGKNKNPVEELKENIEEQVKNEVELNDISEDETALADLKRLLILDKDNVVKTDLNDKRKGEILIIIEEFLATLNSGVERNIKFAYLAYKFTAIANRKYNLNLFKITTIMEREKMI